MNGGTNIVSSVSAINYEVKTQQPKYNATQAKSAVKEFMTSGNTAESLQQFLESIISSVNDPNLRNELNEIISNGMDQNELKSSVNFLADKQAGKPVSPKRQSRFDEVQKYFAPGGKFITDLNNQLLAMGVEEGISYDFFAKSSFGKEVLGLIDQCVELLKTDENTTGESEGNNISDSNTVGHSRSLNDVVIAQVSPEELSKVEEDKVAANKGISSKNMDKIIASLEAGKPSWLNSSSAVC